MQPPGDRKELQRFMGMVNYLGKFIPNLSENTQPLHKEVAWHWSQTHQNTLEALKSNLTEESVLKYYEVAKPVTISGDASSYGLGACLMQDGCPVSYASRSLTRTEQNYAQIEKELLAIVFACSKYHQHIYAKPVTVETDHKPLEYIFRKPLTAKPPRLQRMLLTLQKYDLDVVYKPGKSLFIADILGRAPQKAEEETTTTDEELYQVRTLKYLSVSTRKLDQFRAETAEDTVLQKLQRTVHSGWPDEKSSVDMDLRQYWSVRHEISQQDGNLLRGERLTVPSSLRSEMLQKIHENHLGIEKCKRRARDVLYWPGMNDQIAQRVSRCANCQTYRRAQQKEPIRAHDVPGRPWQKVGVGVERIT